MLFILIEYELVHPLYTRCKLNENVVVWWKECDW